MQCPQCGFVNQPDAPVCAQCGSWLPAAAEGPSPAAGGGWTDLIGEPVPDAYGRAPEMAPTTAPGLGAPPVAPYPDARSGAEPPPFAPGAPSYPAPYPDGGSPYGPSYGPSYGGGAGPWSSAPPPSVSAFPPAGALVVRAPSGLDLGFGAAGLSSMPLGLGTLLKGGRYRLIQPFSEAGGEAPAGGEPPLVIAHDTEVPNTRVLVQELPLRQAGAHDAEYARQLVGQRLIALSRVPGLARLVDSFGEQGRHFLVFELPSGDLLSDRLQRARGRLPEITAVSIAMQLLDILAELEREYPPVTHGNIAPAHVVLRPSGQVALVGISPTLLLHPDGHVPAGIASGVPGFAAPEQARGQASPRSDLYAVCALLYAAVTGAPPAMHATTLYQPAHRANPDVSIELEEALSKGLRPSQSQRFQAAEELRAALRPIAAGRRTTRTEDDLLDGRDAARRLVPVRNARGRLVMPRQPLLQNPLFLVASVVVLIVLIGGGALYTLLPGGGTTLSPDDAVMREAATLFQSKGIGLSGGEYVFDSSRVDNDLKQRAARALAAGDGHTALGLYAQAVTADPADAEAAIYAANLQVDASHTPFVTLAAAVAFESSDSGDAAPHPDVDDARAELQGVYLAQRRVNTANVLPGGAQLRVLILNSGQSHDDASIASRLLLDEIRAGNAQRLIGIVGWPESEETASAISALAPSGLAIVSPGASGDKLGGNAASFFRTVPSDSTQAEELADAARRLNARRICLVSDPNDPLSAAMAAHFSDRVGAQYAGAMSIVRRDAFVGGGANDYGAIVANAITYGADLIYLAGNDGDAIGLATAIAARSGAGAPRLRVLVGPHADTPALRGLGTGPVADAARAAPNALGALYVATLANTDAWGALGLSTATNIRFSIAYKAQFVAASGLDPLADPSPTTILAYDSANLLVAAAGHVPTAGGGAPREPDPTAIRTQLRAFDAQHPFVGVGGAIGFTITGALPQKALTILRFATFPDTKTGALATAQVAAVVGGKQLFCGPTNCAGA